MRAALFLMVLAGSGAAVSAAEDPVVEARQAFLSGRRAASDGKFEKAHSAFNQMLASSPVSGSIAVALTLLPSGTYKATASVPVSNIAFGMCHATCVMGAGR